VTRPRLTITPRPTGTLGERVAHLEVRDAWVVDSTAGREGPAELVLDDGKVAGITWRRSRSTARGRNGIGNAHGPRDSTGQLLVLPGMLDLHAHFREPGGERAETIATGLAAAAHGGFTTVCLMANTDPPADSPDAVREMVAAGARTGSPVRVAPFGAITRDRAGSALAPLAELAAAGAVGFSDDGSPVADGALFRHALTYAAGLHRPVVEHAEEPALSQGGEANEGLTSTVLGLRGISSSAETAAVARNLEILADVVSALPADTRPRLHLTHLSCAGSTDLVRRAKAEGLPVTCDVTPHHLALHDGWLGGDRRLTWRVAGSPWTGGPADAEPFDPNTRVNPPLRSHADALALAEALGDGTVDAIATDHAPHAEMDKAVEFGDAVPGISGIETALGLILEAVDSGALQLATAVRALTVGASSVLNGALDGAREQRHVAAANGRHKSAFGIGALADLVVVDRTDRWLVTPEALLSKGKNTPLIGRRLPGRVLLTVAQGRIAYAAPDLF
jgi:dihydroorotase